MRKEVLVLCAALSFAGCAHLEALRDRNSAVSYVSKEISEHESEMVGADMAKFLSGQFPAAKTTIYVEPSNTLLRSVLVKGLTEKGFGILDIKPEKDPVVILQYFVTGFDNGILWRMRYQDRIASRYYARRPDGSLSFSNKIAVRGTEK